MKRSLFTRGIPTSVVACPNKSALSCACALAFAVFLDLPIASKELSD